MGREPPSSDDHVIIAFLYWKRERKSNEQRGSAEQARNERARGGGGKGGRLRPTARHRAERARGGLVERVSRKIMGGGARSADAKRTRGAPPRLPLSRSVAEPRPPWRGATVGSGLKGGGAGAPRPTRDGAGVPDAGTHRQGRAPIRAQVGST